MSSTQFGFSIWQYTGYLGFFVFRYVVYALAFSMAAYLIKKYLHREMPFYPALLAGIFTGFLAVGIPFPLDSPASRNNMYHFFTITAISWIICIVQYKRHANDALPLRKAVFAVSPLLAAQGVLGVWCLVLKYDVEASLGSTAPSTFCAFMERNMELLWGMIYAAVGIFIVTALLLVRCLPQCKAAKSIVLL